MALTGAQVGNTCYANYNDAWDAHFLAFPRTVLANGASVYYQKNYAAWVWERVEVSPTGVQTITTASAPNFPTCDPYAGFSDGLATSALVSGALIMATMWGIMARAK